MLKLGVKNRIEADDSLVQLLSQELPNTGVLLELLSGSGEQGAKLSQLLPKLLWQPSELIRGIAAINTRREKSQCRKFLPSLVLDTAHDVCPVHHVDAVLGANLLQQLYWHKGRILLKSVASVLKQAGIAVFYHDAHEPYGSIKTRAGHPLEQLLFVVRRYKLRLFKDIALPANRRLFIFKKENIK